MMARRVFGAMLVVVVFAGAARADVLAISAVLHTTAEATGGEPATDGNTDAAFGFHVGNSACNGTISSGTIASRSISIASVPNTIGGGIIGHNEVDVQVSSGDSMPYHALAEGLVDVSFQVTAIGRYDLSIADHWEGNREPMLGFSDVQLYDEANSKFLGGAHAEVTTPGIRDVSGDFDQPLLLEPETSYHLTGHTIVTVDSSSAGRFSANAFATFNLIPVLPGDYDFNHVVDQLDYGFWLSHFGSTTELDADGNLDGVVDAADYVVWRDHVGLQNGGSGAGAPGVVPEPAVLPLMLLFIAVARRCVERR